MPKTFVGELSSFTLAGLVILFLVFFIRINIDGLGAIVNFIKVVPFIAIVGLVSGVISTMKEDGVSKAIPIFTSLLSILSLSLTVFFLYGWSFGG